MFPHEIDQNCHTIGVHKLVGVNVAFLQKVEGVHSYIVYNGKNNGQHFQVLDIAGKGHGQRHGYGINHSLNHYSYYVSEHVLQK